jgi:PKD repeat protein
MSKKIKSSLVKATIKPVAAFTADVLSGNSPLIVRFLDKSVNKPTSWLWDFGDGTASKLKNPKHIYNKVGNYNVNLQAVKIIMGHYYFKDGYHL